MQESLIVEKSGSYNQLRVESCIGMIMKIKKKIKGFKNIDPVFIFQFNKLEAIIPQLKTDNISEADVEKIEVATNNLFEQMRTLFDNRLDSEVYKGQKH